MALVSLVLALSGGAASAVTFDWSTSGPSGSGTFTATEGSNDAYTITAITGTFDGGTITSLIPSDGYRGNSDILFYPGPYGGLDGIEVSFVDGATDYLLYFDVTGNEYIYYYGAVDCNTCGAVITSLTASVSATPLPAALPLFATGIGAMGLLGWRRKRKKAGVIAAA
jgi:hypothetical protein